MIELRIHHKFHIFIHSNFQSKKTSGAENYWDLSGWLGDRYYQQAGARCSLEWKWWVWEPVVLHPFKSLFSRKTWVSRYQKGKTSLDLHKARDDGFWESSGISWTICKQSAPRSRQITTTTPHHSIFTGRMLFLTPKQQHQSTEGNLRYIWTELEKCRRSWETMKMKTKQETD